LGELSGHVLSHYQLGELLGKNSHKAVFQALDRKTNETVVLKVLSPSFPAAPEESQRFIEGMRKVLHLHHPSLVGLRGAGRTGPYTWIAREHVAGDSLTRVLEKIAAGESKGQWQSGLRLAKQRGSLLEHVRERHVRKA